MPIGYRELAAVLREAIQRGDYPPGTTLPKQEDLAAEHGININTVRKTVAVLEAEGLVDSVRRRGTVVRARPPVKRLEVERYAKSGWKFGLGSSVAGEAPGRDDQTDRVSRVGADTEVAEALGLEVGDTVCERARLVRDHGAPTHILTSYYNAAHVEGTPLVDPRSGPATTGDGFAVLTFQGYEPDHMTENVHSRMPRPEEVEELELPAGEPVVVLTRRTFTKDGTPIEFARGVHAASRFVWTYSFQIPE